MGLPQNFHQDGTFHDTQKDRKKSGRRLTLMFWAIVTLTTLASMAVTSIFALIIVSSFEIEAAATFGLVSALTAIPVVGTIVYVWRTRLKELKRLGGPGLAKLLGGEPLIDGGKTESERELTNVINEMALAANIRPPAISILRREPSMNCFTAGWSEQDLVFGITAGGLNYWNRNELQAVVAHELSHSYHGDCEENLRLLAMATGVASIAVTGMAILESAEPDDNDGLFSKHQHPAQSPFVLAFGAALFGVGYIGFYLASKMQLAVCRQHEFLADATAVQLTRDDLSMADALRRVMAQPRRGELRTKHKYTASHLFLVDSDHGRRISTHPILAERIIRLDPKWDGSRPEVRKEPPVSTGGDWQPPDGEQDARSDKDFLSAFPSSELLQEPTGLLHPETLLNPERLLDTDQLIKPTPNE